MNNLKLYEELYTLLRMESRYCSEDGNLLKNSIVESALALRPDLIKLLLSHEGIKSNFFTDVEGVMVFDKVRFQKFVMNKRFLPDSYTSFKNKIGLTGDDGDFLADSCEVVLSWPYKDCVLEGGQTKEDAKRNEIFWNEILAPDEINRLTEPKALTSFARYDVDGKHEVYEISDKDNLIIKGNNLLALHSLLAKYRGKVKLIYIDPPYNTGNDGFQYNDSFNHSSWLTFMRNRLVIANQLLSKEGLIFVHCDNNEQAYLKVLMDEIFGRENFAETISVVNNPRGRDYGCIANMHELIHVYAKDFLNATYYRIVDEDKEFQYADTLGGFDIRELRNRNTAFNSNNRKNLFYPFYLNPHNKDENGFYEIGVEEIEGWVMVNPAISQGIQTVWRWGKPKAIENLNINIVGKKMQDEGRYMIVEKYRENARLARSVWWDKDVNSEKGTVHLKELFGEKVFAFPKPETLLKRIVEIATTASDIVLDYHLGSGTTAAVAHKMGRRYIGVEQMDYIETVAVERLKKVVGVKSPNGMFDKIESDQGGISKAVNWQGGGSFVYCELAKANQQFVEDIIAASTDEELTKIWNDIQQTGFISWKVSPRMIDEAADEFDNLSLEDKQNFLLEILDKNLLYVPLADIEDETYNVSDTDKHLNEQFYGR
ncbi:MAG: site-specific DNA-methyltransferase [bacterium]